MSVRNFPLNRGPWPATVRALSRKPHDSFESPYLMFSRKLLIHVAFTTFSDNPIALVRVLDMSNVNNY